MHSHFIELDWRAATGVGANNGGLTLWIDGVQQADLTGVDNDTWRVDRARLGALIRHRHWHPRHLLSSMPSSRGARTTSVHNYYQIEYHNCML